MSNRDTNTIVERVAQVISDLFSPIVLPTYMIAIAMWMTSIVVFPEKGRFIAMGVIALLTAVVPTAVILTLIKTGRVKDVSLSARSERMIPYIVTIVCYAAAAIYLKTSPYPGWLSAFYFGAAGASVVASLVTLKWKISAHSSAVGGFAAAMIWLALNGQLYVGATWWVCGAIVLCGLVGSARLTLDRHTPAQVYAGFALGALAELVALELLN